MTKISRTIKIISCVLSLVLIFSCSTMAETEPAASNDAASAPSKIDRFSGFVWLTGGGWSGDDNSSYGRNYRDIEAPLKISRLDLRYFNDRQIEYHVGGLEVGTLNSRYFGVLYLADKTKLDFDGGRISHTTFHNQGFKTQRDWVEISALQDIHPFLTLSLSFEGYNRDGFHKYNYQSMGYNVRGIGLNYLRNAFSGQIFYKKGDFRHPTLGYDQIDFGYFLGRRFRDDRDFINIAYERDKLQSHENSGAELENHFLSGVYSTSPSKDWTFRGALRGNVRDNRLPSIFTVDTFTRSANLDAIYHGFKKIRAKARVTAFNIDRYARQGRSLLPDTEDVSTEFRFSNKGKCWANWDFHYKYTDRNGGSFLHADETHADKAALNAMDYFPGNSFKRSQAALACSKSFNKEKFLFSCNLQRDWTDYSRNMMIGIDDMRYDSAMANFTWFANKKLTLGFGAGGTVTEMKALTSVWYAQTQRNLEDNYTSRDDVYNFNLSYSLSSRTNFSADLLSTRGFGDGLVYPNRFGELDQRYDLEYRCSKDSRVGFRYSHSRYVERVYGLEDGRVRRWDIDYRILF